MFSDLVSSVCLTDYACERFPKAISRGCSNIPGLYPTHMYQSLKEVPAQSISLMKIAELWETELSEYTPARTVCLSV